LASGPVLRGLSCGFGAPLVLSAPGDDTDLDFLVRYQSGAGATFNLWRSLLRSTASVLVRMAAIRAGGPDASVLLCSLASPELSAWHCAGVAHGRDLTPASPPSRRRSLSSWGLLPSTCALFPLLPAFCGAYASVRNRGKTCGGGAHQSEARNASPQSRPIGAASAATDLALGD
jgi:hypothetical protein